MLMVDGIRQGLNVPGQEAFGAALKKAKIAPGLVERLEIAKVSVDARHKTPQLVYAVALWLKDAAREERYQRQGVRWLMPKSSNVRPGAEKMCGPVVVCGLGPAGLFCALELAALGYAPIVLERGPNMEERRRAVQAFEETGALCENANIQFGEGGAGTFSDGKLTTRINDPLCALVTQYLLDAGAPEEIAYRAKPHIGTDKLRLVFTTLRQRLEELGGQVRFNTRLLGFEVAGGRVASVPTTGGDIPCGALVLATGHSARDTFAALDKAGVAMQPKAFSVGVRIEHLQADIDAGLYHEAAGHPALPPGEYQLSTKCGGRGVYTFCMCPGGSVVAAASEEGGVVTNGMSEHARGGKNANAALVASVGSADFGEGVFDGIAMQRHLEHVAYAAGGGDYAAPAETVGSFLQQGGRLSLGRVQPSYPRGVKAAPLGELLPAQVAAALRQGLAEFGRKLPGFAAEDAVLTGIETRTSSPVRVPRGDGFESLSTPGLYPCGEGAGYAGGIMSAAVDGIRVARAIIGRFAPPE